MKFLVSTICLSLLLLVSCKPDSDKPCRDSYVKSESFSYAESTRFPFQGTGDTLRYINATGDSLWCIGAAKEVFCTCFPVTNNPECTAKPDSFGFAINHYQYLDSLQKLAFEVTAYHADSTLIIKANNAVFTISLLKVDSVSLIDSLPFGNKMFYNLLPFVNANGDSLYYNYTYGMVGLKHGSQRFYIYRFNQN